VSRLRVGKRLRLKVGVGASDPSLTGVSGRVAVSELCDQLGVVQALDAVVGPIKQRARGYSVGQLLVGLAAVQLAGEDHLVGLDRHRADAAGQMVTPVAGVVLDDRRGLARWITESGQAARRWRVFRGGVGHRRPLGADGLRGRGQAHRGAVAHPGRGEGDPTGVEAIDMPGAQVAVADYRPAWWPLDTPTIGPGMRRSPTPRWQRRVSRGLCRATRQNVMMKRIPLAGYPRCALLQSSHHTITSSWLLRRFLP
jgi:hypothetical protein